jgi:putative glutamine amidotransferase
MFSPHETLPRIAIPMPHASDPSYAERAIPQYERAVALAGGEPVRIALDWSTQKIKNVIDACDGVLLPGSKADVDPARFHAVRSLKTAAADPRRDEVDSLLLDDAYRLLKPVLGICYGLQSLNVYRAGSLIQHIADFLPEETRGKVNHEAGSQVLIAHLAEINCESLLGKILRSDGPPGEHALSERSESNGSGQTQLLSQASKITLPVNSSHHQSADSIGTSLRIIARCPDDGIIEALAGTDDNHFVLAVQWHPERSVDQDEASGQIFRAFVEAAGRRNQ